jgi:TRAP-type C4-dicarboxylate transport system permease small subunit
MRRLVDALALGLALIGGALLLAVALLTVVSVTGRWFANRPLIGDVELVQLAIAAAIALFLPYCQLRRSHLIVDFFTARSSGRIQRRLDAVGSGVAGMLLLLLAWRAAVAVSDMREAAETTMVLGVPLWIPYAVTVPCLALAGVVGLVQALEAVPSAAPRDAT